MTETPPENIMDDIKAFVELWKKVGDETKSKSNDLMKEYNISKEFVDYEDGYYRFELDGIDYEWDYDSERLYLDDDKTEVTSGPAHDYAIKSNAITEKAYNIVRSEMDKRGWYYDPDEYEYYISKDGWQTTLPYFANSIDEIGEFEYDPENI